MSRYCRPRRGQAEHTDDWLLTYADIITLLLCLFVTFLSVTGSRKVVTPAVSVPVSVTQAVQSADIFDGKPPFEDIRAPDHARETQTSEDVSERAAPLLVKLDPISGEPLLGLVARNAENAGPVFTVDVPDSVASEEPANPEPKGDRITTFAFSSAAFFSSGSARLSGSGLAILQTVATDILSEKFVDYQVTVEGHTDDAPIGPAMFPSNWELSSARAAAVVHYFLDKGVPARRLRAAGYADSLPVAPNRDAAGNVIAQNQARNRRVVIRLEKMERSQP